MLRDWEDTEMRVSVGAEMEVGLQVSWWGQKVTALEFGRVGKGCRERHRLWRSSSQSAWQELLSPDCREKEQKQAAMARCWHCPCPGAVISRKLAVGEGGQCDLSLKATWDLGRKLETQGLSAGSVWTGHLMGCPGDIWFHFGFLTPKGI